MEHVQSVLLGLATHRESATVVRMGRRYGFRYLVTWGYVEAFVIAMIDSAIL